MLKKTVLIMFLLVLAISLIVTGCGGGGNDSSNSSNDTQKEDGNQQAEQPKEKAEPVNWIANSVWPPNNHISVGLESFAKKANEATNGQVNITVQSGGALGYKGPELLKVVRDGLVPVSDMLISGVAGDEPTFGVVSLPFLVRGIEEGHTLINIARPYFDKIAEEKWNQKILYIAPWPPSGFWTKNKAKSLADVEGLKMRTFDKNGALVVEAAGGTPYPLPFSEVYSSLATGVIDSVMTSPPTAVDAKFWEVLDYYIPVSVAMGTDMVSVNLNEFNKLDKETQDALIKAAKETETEMWESVAAENKAKKDIVAENGIETVEPSKEFMDELFAVTESIRQEYLKNAPEEAKKIVEEFNKAVGRD